MLRVSLIGGVEMMRASFARILACLLVSSQVYAGNRSWTIDGVTFGAGRTWLDEAKAGRLKRLGIHIFRKPILVMGFVVQQCLFAV